MAIRVEKPAFNVREKLTELDSASIPYERMPKGSVIQVQHKYFPGYVTVGQTTTPTKFFDLNIYPKRKRSKFLVNAIIYYSHGGMGNQNADGTYVELGFRPALIWVKNMDSSSGHWVIVDKERDPINVLGRKLAANLNNAELLGGSFRAECDFLSNGFKMRGTSTDSSGMNKSDTYVYCAWAEAPTVDLYGGGANAR